MEISQKVKNRTTIWLNNSTSTSGYLSEGTEKIWLEEDYAHACMCMSPCSLPHYGSQDMEAI